MGLSRTPGNRGQWNNRDYVEARPSWTHPAIQGMVSSGHPFTGRIVLRKPLNVARPSFEASDLKALRPPSKDGGDYSDPLRSPVIQRYPEAPKNVVGYLVRAETGDYPYHPSLDSVEGEERESNHLGDHKVRKGFSARWLGPRQANTQDGCQPPSQADHWGAGQEATDRLLPWRTKLIISHPA